MKLEITYKNYGIPKVITLEGCGVCLALSMARGLLSDNENIWRVAVLDNSNIIQGIADRD